MRVLRLFIPGEYQDVQLYMGHLVAFTAPDQVEAIELEPLASAIGEKFHEWSGVAVAAFARNDWLGSAQFHNWMTNSAVSGALRSTIAELEDQPLVIEKVDFKPLHGFSLKASVLLDTLFYGRRLYVGADSGFYDFDIDWGNVSVRRLRRRLDMRCVSASAEYGAVNASCEDEGLYTGYDEFGWRGSTSDDHPALRQTAAASLRTSWLRRDLVNYQSQDFGVLLKASVEEVEDIEDGPFGRGRVRKRALVTSFDTREDELARVLDHVATEHGFTPADVQFVWNSSTSFLINTYTHGFFTAAVDSTPAGHLLPHISHYPGVLDRVVAAHTTPAGWIIETDFRLFLFTRGELTLILDDEPLAVRTFAGSKRFRHLIAATVEDGVHLLCLVDDGSF